MKKKILLSLSLCCFFIFQSQFGFSQNCVCTEYIYLNETTGGGSVHKYAITANGTLTEVLNNGNAWYPGAGASQLPSPHGLTTDLNGFLYIGEEIFGNLRKLTCEGTLFPVSDFELPTGSFNLGAIGNTLYNSACGTPLIEAWDICSGQNIGNVCMNGLDEGTAGCFFDTVWDFKITDDGTFYVYSGINAQDYGGTTIWKFTEADFNSGSCVDPYLTSLDDGTSPNVGDSYLPDTQGRGIVVEGGFIYIVEYNGPGGYRIIKYDEATGVVVAVSPYDSNNGDGGWFDLHALQFSQTSGLLYSSTVSNVDDCVSVWDTDLNYQGAAVPATGTGAAAKGMAIAVECCPSPSVQTIPVNLCVASLEELNLADQFPCDGVVCEGQWTANDAASVAIFDDCALTITPTTAGCYSYTKMSGQLGPVNQCGAFTVTLDICIAVEPTVPAISFVDNTCNPDIAGSFNIDTPCGAGSSIEFSVDGGATWSGTAPSYDDAVTVRARCVSDIEATCFSAETAEITSAPEECCPPAKCINQYGEFTITKRRP